MPLVNKLLGVADTLEQHLEADAATYAVTPFMFSYGQAGNEIFMLNEGYANYLEQQCEDLVEKGKILKGQMQDAINKCSGIIDCSAEQTAINEAYQSVLRIENFKQAFQSYVIGVRDLDESLRLDFQTYTDSEVVETGKALREVVNNEIVYNEKMEKLRDISAKSSGKWTEEEWLFIEENYEIIEKEEMETLLFEIEIGRYLKNLRNSDLNLLSEKKETIYAMAEILLREGYEPAFVAGILGNISAEGKVGQFESSNYKTNPEKKPDYMQYMDDHHDYRNKFSGKSISEVGISETQNLIKRIEKDGGEGKFGLGCVQWTGSRTEALLACYKDVCGEENYPTREQCIEAEGMFIIQELNGNYSEVYEEWCESCNNINSIESAVQAGRDVCKKYESPRTDTSEKRGEEAGKIYKALMGTSESEEMENEK